MYLNGNTLAVVLDRNLARLSVQSHPNLTHILVILLVVRRIDQNLIENLV